MSKTVFVVGSLVALAIGNEVLSLLVVTGWAFYGLYRLLSAAAEMNH
jgi:hypothetical protein